MEGWFQLARVEKAVGHNDETLSALKHAAEIAPDNVPLLAMVGSACIQQNRTDEAIPLLQHAAEISPNEAVLQSQLGLAYQKQGKHADSAKAFERATQLAPTDRQNWERLAEEYRALGQTRCQSRRRPRTIPSFDFNQNRKTLISLRFQQRKQNHVADRFGAGEEHHQAVDADAETAGGRHAVFEREQKIFVELLCFSPACSSRRWRCIIGSFSSE